ncbi:MAG: hypothetical protein IT353_13045 [Gemmatimonadaceae bacterium]|nr:hypothetical protein [Gemmatimonadaceae bacterium]
MRPEVVAFRELDTLVRGLTDQLAGYRRRALAAETRARELERAVEATRLELTAATAARSDAEVASRAALTALPAAPESLAELEKERALQEAAAEAAAEAARQQADGADGTDGDQPLRRTDPLAIENERLKSRLAEARDRTAQLGDRVRFLRQQLMQGAER